MSLKVNKTNSTILKKKIKNIKIIFTDFDGTLTDNKVLVDENGKESVFCNRADGQAINYFKKKNYEVICLSTEKNNVVLQRCKKLKIKCYNKIDNKEKFLKDYCKKNKSNLRNIALVGNSYNDLDALKIVGLSVAVKDSVRIVKKISDIILTKNGGEGVLEELFSIFDIR